MDEPKIEVDTKLTTGYIKISRAITAHWLYEPQRKRTKLEAWIDLLLRAKYTSNKEAVGYDLIVIERGQILTSQEELSRAWRWDRTTVRRFLTSLHTDQILTIKTTSKYTILTICNYELYNGERPTKPQEHRHQVNTTSTHSIIDKKESNIILSKDSIVGLDEPTPTKVPTFEDKCKMFIEKFNEIKNSKYQVTDIVRTKLKARLKNYKASDIIKVLRSAMKDKHHIENGFVYVTPEFVLRQVIVERYLNATPKEEISADPAQSLPPKIDHRA